MEIFNGKLAEEHYEEERKRKENEHDALRQEVVDMGQRMISFVKTNNIRLEHSVIVEDYYFLARDEDRNALPNMRFMVFGPKRLGYSNKPEIDGIYDGMFIGDGLSAIKQMEEFMASFKANNQ